MNNRGFGASGRDGESPRRRWYAVFTAFPFIFLPLVTLIAVLCAIILPYIRGVAR